MIDVGAHAGYYTLIAARAVGDKGRVFAFEPELSNYKLICKNVQLNSYRNVVPVRKAVTNITGSIKLFLAEKIFTEFSPEELKRAGCLPIEYLKKLINYGFNIYLIDEKKQSLEPAEVSHVMKVCKSMGYVNLPCHRGQRGVL